MFREVFKAVAVEGEGVRVSCDECAGGGMDCQQRWMFNEGGSVVFWGGVS